MIFVKLFIIFQFKCLEQSAAYNQPIKINIQDVLLELQDLLGNDLEYAIKRQKDNIKKDYDFEDYKKNYFPLNTMSNQTGQEKYDEIDALNKPDDLNSQIDHIAMDKMLNVIDQIGKRTDYEGEKRAVSAART